MRIDRHAAMRRFISLGLLFTACVVDDANDLGPVDGEAARAAPMPPAPPPPPPALEDAAWLVTTLLDPTDPSCPDLTTDSWTLASGRMFNDGTPGLMSHEFFLGMLPAHLERFCLYSWGGVPGAHTLPTDPLSIAPLAHMSIDLPVVTANGNGFEEAYRPQLAEVFFSQSGRINEWSPKGESPVRVAVVDSESELSSHPYIEHASAMISIIEALACDDLEPNRPGEEGEHNGCNIGTYRALALPLLEDGSERTEGGYYGTRAHVAMAIVESVLGWRKALDRDEEDSQLVINLSLGWVATGLGGCGQGDAEPWCEATGHGAALLDWLSGPPVGAPNYATEAANEAVHTALVYASCNGAVIVAAAGNGRDDSCNEALMAPASWSYLPAPTPKECGDLGFSPPEQYTRGHLHSARPLLVPVSAVDHNDQQISATRPGTETRLVAPGYMATVGSHMTPLTGTSVSAAVVSGAAARLWAHQPERSQADLIDQLYATAVPTGRISELEEHGVPANTISRRVSLCDAAGPDCDGDLCPGSWCVPTEPLTAQIGAMNTQATMAIDQGMSLSPADATELYFDGCSRCGTPVNVWVPDGQNQDHHFYGDCDWTLSQYLPEDDDPALVGPQPDSPLCPDCPVVSSLAHNQTRALLALDTWYGGMTVEGVTIQLERLNMAPELIDVTTVSDWTTNLQSGDMVRVNLPGVQHTASHPLRRATLGMMLLSPSGYRFYRSNQLLVVPPH